MFTVKTKKEGVFWFHPGRCCKLNYANLSIKDHKNYQDILAELIKPYGMIPFGVPEMLKLIMKATYQEDGTYEIVASPVKKGGLR